MQSVDPFGQSLVELQLMIQGHKTKMYLLKCKVASKYFQFANQILVKKPEFLCGNGKRLLFWINFFGCKMEFFILVLNFHIKWFFNGYIFAQKKLTL